MGRKAKFTPEEFETRVHEYFAHLLELKEKGEEKPPSLVGLANFLPLNVGTLYYYGTKEEYADPYAMAKQHCEEYYVNKLLTGKAPPAAVIFVLTQNFHGWVNRQRTESTGANGGPQEVNLNHRPMPADVQNELDAHEAELTNGKAKPEAIADG